MGERLFLILPFEVSFSFCSVHSDQKQIFLEKGEKERREKKREKKVRVASEIKKQGGVSSDPIYCKSLGFSWNFPVLFGQ